MKGVEVGWDAKEGNPVPGMFNWPILSRLGAGHEDDGFAL